MIDRFGNENFNDNYKNYVEDDGVKVINEFYKSAQHRPAMGSDTFLEEISNYVKQHSLSAEVVGAENIIAPPDIKTIIKQVSEYYNLPISTIQKAKSRTKNTARRAVIFLAREIGGYKLTEIAGVMGGVSIKTISCTIYRTKEDKQQMKEIGELEKILLHGN